MLDPAHNRIESAAGPEYAYGYQHPYQIRNDTYGGLESPFRPLHEGVEDIDPLVQGAGYDEPEDQQDQPSGEGSGKRLNTVRVEGPQIQYDPSYYDGQAAYPQQDGRLEYIDLLPVGYNTHGRDGRYESGNDDGNEQIRWISHPGG